MKHYRLFPFVSQPQMDYIHRNVVFCIESRGFHFELPHLPNHVVHRISCDSAEVARLGFVGDAHISSSIATELRRCYPDATAHFYSCLRSVLVANSTFAHLMKKVGLFRENDRVKPAGDAFEAILAAFYAESGPDEFHAYIKKYFSPLIITAGHAFKNSCHFPKTSFRKTRQRLSKLSLPRPKGPATGKMGSTRHERGLVPLRHPLPLRHTDPVYLSRNEIRPATSPETMDLTCEMDSEDERAIVMLTLLPARSAQPSSSSNQVIPDRHPPLVPSCSRSEPPFRLSMPMPQQNKYPVVNPACHPHSHMASLTNSNSGSLSTMRNGLVLYSEQGNNRDNPIILD